MAAAGKNSPTFEARVPSKESLEKLLRKLQRHQNEIDTASGEMGEAVSRAVEKENLHKGAFAWVKKLQKMDPQKMGVHLAHFDAMRDILELDARVTPDMFEAMSAELTGEEGDEDEDGTEDETEAEAAPSTAKGGKKKAKAKPAKKAKAAKPKQKKRVTGKDAASGEKDDDDTEETPAPPTQPAPSPFRQANPQAGSPFGSAQRPSGNGEKDAA